MNFLAGYRDDSLETVKRNEQQYGIPLRILSYKELYGWTMDEIVAAIGHRNNCTFCGVFRRQALDRGATLLTPNFSGDFEPYTPGWLTFVDRAGNQFIDETLDYSVATGAVCAGVAAGVVADA